MTVKWDAKAAAAGDGTEIPAWVEKTLEHHSTVERFDIDRFTDCTLRQGDRLTLATVRVRRADDLDPLGFQRQTVLAYRAIANALERREARHPIRFWNFIPDINKPVSESLSRYMVFNAGRFSAFHDWYGEAKAFGRYVATASGVGHAGRDLVIHCLSSATPGVAIENPRQVSSYNYSEHYGPLPPTFARATAVNFDRQEASFLLVGGTASIRGERSLHHGNTLQQTIETLHNLAAVVRTGAAAHCAEEFPAHWSDRSWLECFRSLRVYHVRATDQEHLAAVLGDHGVNLDAIEWRQASLCRPELLVEIEGVAHLPRIMSIPHEVPALRERAALEA